MELFAFNQNGKVFLYWNKVPNIDGYRIFKKNSKNVFDGFQTSENENAYVDITQTIAVNKAPLFTLLLGILTFGAIVYITFITKNIIKNTNGHLIS